MGKSKPKFQPPTRSVHKHFFDGVSWKCLVETEGVPPEEISGEQVVHIVDEGKPLCNFSSEPPYRWPKGHYQIPFVRDRQGQSTDKQTECEKCFEKASVLWLERYGSVDLPAAGVEIGPLNVLPSAPASCPDCGRCSHITISPSGRYGCAWCGWVL